MKKSLVLSTLVAMLLGCATTPAVPTDEVEAPPQEEVVEAPPVSVEGHPGWAGEEPVDDQARWVLALLNDRGGELTEEEYDLYFNEEIHNALPYEAIAQSMQVIAQMGPFSVLGEAQRQENIVGLLVSGAREERFILIVVVEGEEPNRIRGVNIAPAPDESAELLETWEEIEAALVTKGAQASFLAARIDDGSCEPLYSLAPEKSLGIGSAFKLYVLGAAAKEAREGRLRYEEELEIVDAHRSLPSGQLQDRPAGEMVSLFDVAGKMISISDNTATDLLLARLGRSTVEGYLSALGHSAPEKMTPFLYTHEFFKLKLSHDEETRDRYGEMNTEERREFLRSLQEVSLPEISAALSWRTPRHIETIEWFASAEDLCALFSTFKENRDEAGSSEVFQIMAANPGALQLEGRASYIGFKAGSEPGVLNFSWIIEDQEGQWYSLIFTVNDSENPISQMEVHHLARSAAHLLIQ